MLAGWLYVYASAGPGTTTTGRSGRNRSAKSPWRSNANIPDGSRWSGRDDARLYDGSLTGGAPARPAPRHRLEERESHPVRYPGRA